MPANSRQIVKEVNNTTHLDEALSLVVKRSGSFMGADACSVYIHDPQTDRFILMAVESCFECGRAERARARKLTFQNDYAYDWGKTSELSTQKVCANCNTEPDLEK